MSCREFLGLLEDYLAQHPGSAPGAVPIRMGGHAQTCRRCQKRWETAVRSRGLLAGLRSNEEPPSDPYFLGRVRARIREQEARRANAGLRGLHVAGRDLVIAAALFATTLGSFVYNFRRTERPNADEAIVLDVPHLNPMHPSDDHVRPKAADVMLSLMNP